MEKGKIVATGKLDQGKPVLKDLLHAETSQSQKIFLQNGTAYLFSRDFESCIHSLCIPTAVLNIPLDSTVFPHDMLEGVALFHCPVFVVF